MKHYAQQALLCAAVAGFAVASYAYVRHDLDVNPQYDTQVLTYSVELIDAVLDDTLPAYLWSGDRKYPLLYSVPFAATLSPLFDAFQFTEMYPVHLIARSITLMFGLLTIVLTGLISRRLTGDWKPGVLLLLSSITFFQFMTAIRPHLPLAFWTMLSFYFSLRLREKRRVLLTVLAFGSAFVAIGTLQNGVLALIFPVWGYMGEHRSNKKLIQVGAIATLTLFLGIFVGYSHLIGNMFAGGGLDATMGHAGGLAFSPTYFLRVALHMMGSEPFVLAFAAVGIFGMWKSRKKRDAMVVPIFVYLVAIFAIFGFYQTADARFFVVTIPLFALLGARTFLKMPQSAQMAFMIFLVAMSARFTWLGLRPSTFQQVNASISTRNGKLGVLSIPITFFGFDNKQLATGDSDLTLMVVPGYETRRAGDEWHVCERFTASHFSDEIILLWVDTPWAIWHLFTANALGANLELFCKSDITSQ